MTTIVFDAKNKQMLGDGRISQGSQITKDDFVKVHNINGILVGAAGVVTHMLKFFEYFDKNTTAEIFQQETMGLVNIVFPETPNEDQFEALVAYPSGELFLFEGNSSILLGQDVSFAIGSGGPYALGALESGADGKEAMRVATKFDTMSGGEVVVVEFDEEQETIDKESAMKMSKEELISKLFPEDEDESVGTEENSEEEVQVDMIHEWSEFIILYKFDDDIFFEVIGVEFNLTQQPVSPKEFIESGEFDLNELQHICSEMNIEYSGNNNKMQLASKICKDIDNKIHTYLDNAIGTFLQERTK